MMGDYVRDKDAVTASMMVAEMAAYYHDKGMNLSQAMESLYEKVRPLRRKDAQSCYART